MEDDEKIDLSGILNIIKKLTLKDIIIFYLIILFLLFVMFHTTEIERCQNYYTNLLNDRDFLTDAIGRITYGYARNISIPKLTMDVSTC